MFLSAIVAQPLLLCCFGHALVLATVSKKKVASSSADFTTMSATMPASPSLSFIVTGRFSWTLPQIRGMIWVLSESCVYNAWAETRKEDNSLPLPIDHPISRSFRRFLMLFFHLRFLKSIVSRLLTKKSYTMKLARDSETEKNAQADNKIWSLAINFWRSCCHPHFCHLQRNLFTDFNCHLLSDLLVWNIRCCDFRCGKNQCNKK